MTLPEGMTSEKLRLIAFWLDTYDKVAESYIAMAESLILNSGPWPEREETLAAIRRKDIQDELRAWADEIDWSEV